MAKSISTTHFQTFFSDIIVTTLKKQPTAHTNINKPNKKNPIYLFTSLHSSKRSNNLSILISTCPVLNEEH